MRDYRSSSARIGILTINMLICIMIIFEAKSHIDIVIALTLGSLNTISMIDCLRQRENRDK